MTDENLFKEVEEDMERQRYEALWKQYGGMVIAAALAIVLGTAGYNFWLGHTQQKNQRATDELVAITGAKTDPVKQIEALQQFVQNNPGQTQTTLAALHAAALAAKQDKKDDAIRMYDAVAADSKADHAFRQLADLLAVQVQMDSGDTAKLLQRLQPLMAEKEPWRYTAMEFAGHIALRAGDKANAKDYFTKLSQDAGAPPTISARAADMLRLIAD